MTERGLPPFPTTNDWRSWATQLVEYLSQQGRSEEQVVPRTVALSHQFPPTTDYKALQDGLMMFNPSLGVPVYSIGGSWEQFTKSGDVNYLATDGAGDGTVVGDVNATDYTGQTGAVGACAQCPVATNTSFYHKGIQYLYTGPTPASYGAGCADTMQDSYLIPVGVGTFLSLTDTPDSYAGATAGQAVIVNQTVDGLEFGAASGSVGVGPTLPSSPTHGDQFYLTIEPVGMYVYVDEDVLGTGTSAQWVQQNGGGTVLSGFVEKTGDTMTGDLTITGYTAILEVGTGGPAALTMNDGYGNANVTFNHTAGIPDQDGSSARIETDVDSTTGRLVLQVADNVTAGVAVNPQYDMLKVYSNKVEVHGLQSAGYGYRFQVDGYTQQNRNASTASAGAYDVHSNWGATGRNVFRINANGNVLNYNNSYGSLSSRELKANIVSSDPALSKLMQVEVVDFTYIGDTTPQRGVIAEDLEVVLPDLVSEAELPTNAADERSADEPAQLTKAVNYMGFVPLLIQTVQEQQKMINALTARLDALENKNA